MKATIRMKTLSTMFCVLLAMLALNSPNADAGKKCKNVKFEFTNNTGAKVKVNKIRVIWDNVDASYEEKFGSKQIDTGETHTTGKQDLQKIDVGQDIRFKIRFRRWSAPNNKWKFVQQAFTEYKKCQRGKTFSFNLTESTPDTWQYR